MDYTYRQDKMWQLGIKDQLGYGFEMDNSEVLRKHGLYKYIKWRNPKNPHSWKRHKGKGVDMVLKVGEYTVYVEESYCSHDYTYRQKWFDRCRVDRFKNYPKQDRWHIYFVLTNRPRNFRGIVSSLVIGNINSLLTLIRTLLTLTLTNNKSVYANDKSQARISNYIQQDELALNMCPLLYLKFS